MGPARLGRGGGSPVCRAGLRGRVSALCWRGGRAGAGLVMALPCCVLRLTREPVAESPKKKRWEAPSGLHSPRGAGPAARGGGAQSQRGAPGAGGAGRARGSSFAKFGNRNVFMKDNSSSSSTESRSRSSSRSPTRHFRRRSVPGPGWGGRLWASSPHVASPSSSFPLVIPTQTRTPPTRGPSAGLWAAGTRHPRAGAVGAPTWIVAGAGRSVGRGEHEHRAGAGVGAVPGGWLVGHPGLSLRPPRHDLAPSKRNRKKLALAECEDPERELKRQKRAARFQHTHTRRLRLGPLVLRVGNLDVAADPDWQELQIVGTCSDITKNYLRLTCAPDPSTVRPVTVSAGTGMGQKGGAASLEPHEPRQS